MKKAVAEWWAGEQGTGTQMWDHRRMTVVVWPDPVPTRADSIHLFNLYNCGEIHRK